MTAANKGLLGAGQKDVLIRVAGAGLLALAGGCTLAPARALGCLLVANFFFVSVSLGALVFIAAQYLSSAGWSVVFRRVPEAMTAYLPAGAVLTAVLLASARILYPWAAPGAAAALGAKAAYLGVWSAAARAAVYWAVWLFFARRLVSLSREQDSSGGAGTTLRAKALSVGFLLCFGATFTLGSVDWLMSLEPKWESTIYPWYIFAGAFEAALAAIIVLVVALRRRGLLTEVNEHHLHDLGKYLFAFSVFWAYLWFSQFLLIWYSNLPEETTFFARRLGGAWGGLFWLMPIVNFAIPFALLLPASRKKREGFLLWAAGLLLAGHWLDLYVLVMPPVLGPRPAFGLLELLAFAGLAAAFLLLFDLAFREAAPVPARDPYLEESVHFEGA